MSITDRLNILISSLGLKKYEFASKIGLEPPSITRILKGEQNISKAAFNSICLSFSVNPDWLKEGIGPMFTSPERELDPEIYKLAKKLSNLPPDKKELLIKILKAGVE